MQRPISRIFQKHFSPKIVFQPFAQPIASFALQNLFALMQQVAFAFSIALFAQFSLVFFLAVSSERAA